MYSGVRKSNIWKNCFSSIVFFCISGAGPRGGHGNDSVFDNYAGIYSYKPKASFCVSESTNKAHVTFNWHPNNLHATSAIASLIMLMMPHHVSTAIFLSMDRESFKV